MKKPNGRVIVISGPSGCGKTSLIRELINKLRAAGHDIELAVSYTTRTIREGEVEGVNYYYITLGKFIQMIEAGEFLEHADVHGKLYGTPISEVTQRIFAGMSVILELDVQGAEKVRRHTMPEIRDGHVSIFVAPPSMAALRVRIQSDEKNRRNDIDVRMANAEKEMACAGAYDLTVVNDDFDEALRVLQEVVGNNLVMIG